MSLKTIQLQYGWVYKQRKCGVDFRLSNRRLWKDLTVINDTMPHTWIVWVYAQIVHSHIATQEMSAVRCPTVLKTSTFSIKDLRKTLS